MAAFVFSLVMSVFFAGTTWLLIGSRFKLKAEEATNDLANVILYLIVFVPLNFLFVFFVLG